MKIPTAKEFLVSKNILRSTERINFPLNLSRDTNIQSAVDIEHSLIEFAKLHVQAALQAAVNNAEIEEEYYSSCPECFRGSPYIDSKSILNSYPETNIK